MSEDKAKKLGAYLLSLREALDLSQAEVSKKTKEYFPNLPEYHWASGYLSEVENGEKFPSGYKLTALGKVYGVTRGHLLYQAGILLEDPDSNLKDWSKETLRDYYLQKLSASGIGEKSLTEEEKGIVENLMVKLISILLPTRSSSEKFGQRTLSLFSDLYLEQMAKVHKRKPLNDSQRQFITKLIADYLKTLPEESSAQ